MEQKARQGKTPLFVGGKKLVPARLLPELIDKPSEADPFQRRDDGAVVEGAADVDESMITGESKAISKAPGASVIAGTVAGGGSLRVRVTAVGHRSEVYG